MEPFLRTQYNYDMNKAGDESGLDCKDPTRTQQSFKDEVNINTLVDRFKLSGQMPQIEKLPSFGDYMGFFDYQSAMNQLVAAQREFMSLPAKTRARFENDPQKYVEFFDDPANREEAVRMGLLAPPPPAPDPEPRKDIKPS